MIKQFNNFFSKAREHLVGSTRWYYITVLVLVSYLLIFQTQFVISGDIWAEAFPEYINEAVTRPVSEIFKSSWAGYLTLIPSFLSKAYVRIGLPLGYVDYYLRACTLIFAVICISFIAHPINRKLINNDYLRMFLAFIMLLAMRHVSVLAFINIWYVGFFVIILMCLSGIKLNRIWEILFTIFAILVVLSKSSLILLPFVLYRTIKLKKYTFGALLSIAISLQTYLTLFAKNGYGNQSISQNLNTLPTDIFLGTGVQLLKTLHIQPPNIVSILITSAVFALIVGFVLYKNSFWKIFTIGAGLTIALYLHIFAPDAGLAKLWTNYGNMYASQGKLQREYVITFLLILIIGIFMSELIKIYKKFAAIGGAILAILILVSINPLSKIDNHNAAVYTDIQPFRSSLNNTVSTCMPVPPTPALSNNASWFFQLRGGCYTKNQPKIIDYTSFSKPITVAANDTHIIINSTSKDELMTLATMVKKTPGKSGTLTLADVNGSFSTKSNILGNSEDYQFVSFNTTGIGPRNNTYELSIRSDVNDVFYTGQFIDTNEIINYGYYMGYPNIQ